MARILSSNCPSQKTSFSISLKISFINHTVFIIINPILFADFTNYFARISCCNRPIRNICGYNTSCTNYYIVSNMYSRTHYRISSKPYIIPYGNLFSIFKSRIACIRVDWMSCRIYRHIWCHLTVITDFYLCHIYNCTVIICKEIFTYFNM